MTRTTSLVLLTAILLGCSLNEPSIEQARSQVKRLADHFDRQTTATGVYIRPANNQAGEKDPWGADIIVEYSQGGMAEVVTVTSAGPDRELHSKDDVAVFRQSTNFKGLGEGIKKNAGGVAGEIAKGAVKGAVEGVKDSVKEGVQDVKDGLKMVLPKKKPDAVEQPAKDAPSP